MSAEPPAAKPAAGKLGFGMTVALVVGNIIGSGVYLVPASLAPYGRNSLSAWLFTAAGAIVLAVVFAALARSLPAEGGLYAYTRTAFGELAGFVVAWGYWVAIWVGNAAIATGAVSYTSVVAPWIVSVPGASVLATLALVWLLTLVNCFGVRAAGWVQVVTTVLKLVPLVAIGLVGLFFVRGDLVTAHAGIPLSLDATTAAATLTLWALLGLESATVPADKVRDPARTIPRATLAGTLVSAVACAVSCSIVLVLVPQAKLASSNAPYADAALVLFGPGTGTLVALFAAISAAGALNGWILLQGELPTALARDGLFPKAFRARVAARSARARARLDQPARERPRADELPQEPGRGVHLHDPALDDRDARRLPRLLAVAFGAAAPRPRREPPHRVARERGRARRALLALGDRRGGPRRRAVGSRPDPGVAAGLRADARGRRVAGGSRRACQI